LGTSSNAKPSATGPSPTRRPGAPATLRGAARAAVGAAWERAAATGALPALPAEAQVTVEIERPASAEHGDLATNLALKLARPA